MEKNDKKVLLIAQEIKLAKILAGNNKKLRDRTLKRLGKWLNDRTANAPVTDDVFLRIWKGLFYSMWMSDKPLVQEQCAENIAKLVHLSDTKTSLMFFKCFLQTMVNEWFGIDHHRIDKFLMLIRRVLRQTFEVLKKADWLDTDINTFREILNQTVLKIDKTTSLSLVLHIDEIYLEELAKVSRGKLSPDKILQLIQPFAQQLARSEDFRQVQHVTQHIFKYLINQSDVGIEYKEKFHIWRRQGFPGGTMDCLEKVELRNGDNDSNNEYNSSDEEEDDNQPKDPRAGKVDVILAQLKFDPDEIAKYLNDLRFKKYTNSIGRKRLGILAGQFRKLAKGIYPLGSRKIAIAPDDGYSTNLKASLKRLNQLEQKVSKDSKKAKQKKLRNQKVQEIISEQIDELIKEQNKDKKKANKKKKLLTKNTDQTEIELNKSNNIKKPKGSTKPFKEDSDDFLMFVQKSEEKLMDAFRKNVPTKSKKRKNSDGDIVMNPVKKNQSKNIITKDDVAATNEADLSKIPIKNQNVFVRNSGLWMVEEIDIPESSPKVKTPEKPMKQSSKSQEKQKKNSPKTSKANADKKSLKFEKNDEWSKPLEDGETEYFVVSKKMKKKVKRLSENKIGPLKRLARNDISITNTPNSSKKNKSIVKNPFSSDTVKNHLAFGTPKSEKKIKFSDNNQAQDFSDHLKQIMSSPGIPYDSKKMPNKPLLKPSPITTPINPFYKRKF